MFHYNRQEPKNQKTRGKCCELSQKLGTDRDGVMAWARQQARIETEKYRQDKEAKTVLIPFHADRPMEYDKQKKYEGGCLAEECDFIQAEAYKNSNFFGKRNDHILYYDCTNYYFEIEQEAGDKKYGKSKEHRTDLLDDDVSDILKVSEGRWQIESCFRIMKTDFSARPVKA